MIKERARGQIFFILSFLIVLKTSFMLVSIDIFNAELLMN